MANFFTEGITITHSDLSRTDLGRLSGMFRISWSTSPACFRRSFSWFCACRVAHVNTAASRIEIFFIFFLASFLYHFGKEFGESSILVQPAIKTAPLSLLIGRPKMATKKSHSQKKSGSRKYGKAA